MLRKIIILIPLLFMIGCTAHAHQNHRHHSPDLRVNVHWVWVDGHFNHARWVRGHWSSRPGPNPHANKPNYVWVPGHYVGHGRNHHWVPGHWAKRR